MTASGNAVRRMRVGDMCCDLILENRVSCGRPKARNIFEQLSKENTRRYCSLQPARIAAIAEEMLGGTLLKNAPDKEHNFAEKCPTSSGHRLTCPKTSVTANTEMSSPKERGGRIRKTLPLRPRARVCRRSVRLRITTHMREGERARLYRRANCGTRPSL